MNTTVTAKPTNTKTEQQFKLRNKCRYIYIARNTKDVITSYSHFEKEKSRSGFYSGDWDHCFELLVGGKVQRGDWFDHVHSWWEHKDADNILFLRYENLKLDLDGELSNIAAFLGLT
ncbi:hypothetical protein ETB97_005143 [Aspergillus alliaceus]|uniref:Sulfotransferase domain-containing protein n=1 Tax=Petromyces alliaceus TaxID=209559 RepID=A0A8H5ZX38_PETAA|nr:hypothetical protein ETB97_005143 [Aspergillus burnettii]